MRIDKFLKISRIIKRRTVAQEAAAGHRITVNGNTAKPSKEVKEGDIVSVAFGDSTLTFRVLQTKDTVRKEEAELMYEIIN